MPGYIHERRHAPPEIHDPPNGDRLYVATEQDVTTKCPCGQGIIHSPGNARVWRRDRRGKLHDYGEK